MFELKKVEKTFPGVRALKGVDFKIAKGEIVGLVGENGAGKSTLMKIMYGQYPHDGGEVTIAGKSVRFESPRQAMDLGIGMVFQEQSLIANLSVMENIFLGHERAFVRAGMINWRKMGAAARKQLAKVKLDIDPAVRTESLTFAQRQLVELAKVLTLEERVQGDLVILLDEPTSVLSAEEVKLLFSLVRDLRSRAAFVFVSHRLDEVIEISDRIYVLKDGEVVDVVDAKEAVVESIQRKMVGRDVNTEYYREDKQRSYDAEHILVETRDLGLLGRYSEVSIKLHAGEVLAIVGADGSGREEVMRSIFGLERPDHGEVLVRGKPITEFSAASGVEHGIAYIPRERKIEGIVAGLNVYENMTLSQLGKYSSFGVLRVSEERKLGVEWIRKLAIKAPSELSDCGNLSGGNQQKVVLAKWRSAGSEVILLDHPTRGLDIGAKEDVYEMVRAMSADGCGVLLSGDTLEEAIGLAHTILVIKDGKIRKTFECQVGSKPTLFDLIHYMI
jgi:ribose transport system ATP-binding protein